MKSLADYDKKIHSCSKCGLCQSVCPIYKITGNDCTVSRGQFIMLRGLIKGELKMSKKINRYLDLCLKCGACSKFCPSGIDVVEIIVAAKAEYFKTHFVEQIVSKFLEIFVFGIGIKLISLFKPKIIGQKFRDKVLYFGGCSGNLKGNKAIVSILNSCGVEVITPNFECCGIPFYVRGDMKAFENAKNSFLTTIEKYDVKEIVTTCTSCEKTIRSFGGDISVKNIFQYLREKGLKPKLKKAERVTFHKPCNLDNYDDIKWILENTENLEYMEMNDFDKCCGLNGISKFSECKIMSKIYKAKHKNILASGAKVVLTSCFGCEIALLLASLGKYCIEDFIEFMGKKAEF